MLVFDTFPNHGCFQGFHQNEKLKCQAIVVNQSLLNPEVVSFTTTIEINIDFLLRLMFEFRIILIQFRIFELHRIQKLDSNLT